MMRLKVAYVLPFVLLSGLHSVPSRATTPPPDYPSFQALSGFLGEIAVVAPNRLLTAAISIRKDLGFQAVYQAIAHDPVSGKDFLLGFDDNQHHSPNSYLGELDFTTGEERTIGTIPGEIVNALAFDGTGNLYGLTDNREGRTPHALLAIDKATAAASVVKVLDSHGGPADFLSGSLAWNPADHFLYYADLGSDGHLFVDRLAPGTFAQTPAVVASRGGSPQGMAFAAGRLWMVFSGFEFSSADASHLAAGLSGNLFPQFPTPDGELSTFYTTSIFPTVVSCVPGPTVACLYNRFKVEVSYDATPQNGSGAGNVILESPQSIKFSFFDTGNVELIVKILNACSPPFNKWWVFAGGLTDVGVSIKVTDTATGAVKTYANPKGSLFQPVADTTAFGCP